MSSDDEAEQFVGDEQGLHGDSHEVADLTGADQAPLDEEDSDNENDTGMPEESHDAHDYSVHTFEGHTGTKLLLHSMFAAAEKLFLEWMNCGGAGAVFAVAWSPTSNLVATGGADDRVFLWQVQSTTLESFRCMDVITFRLLQKLCDTSQVRWCRLEMKRAPQQRSSVGTQTQ